MKVRRILVSVTGERIDSEVVELACNYAKRVKAEVYVIKVIEVKRSLPLDADLSSEVEKGEEILNQAEKIAETVDISIETELLQARDAGIAVVDEAIERGVDLIVLGMGYRNKFGDFNVGKIVPQVLKNAPCWVWVVRESFENV